MYKNALLSEDLYTDSLFVLSGRTKILEAFRKVSHRIKYFLFDLEKKKHEMNVLNKTFNISALPV